MRPTDSKKLDEFARLVGAGQSVNAAAKAAGISRGAGRSFIARRAKAAEAAAEPGAPAPGLPEGANESDIAIRVEMRDALLRRMRGRVDVHELARLTRELNVTLDGLRRARAVPVAEEDFADEDADWVLKKLRRLSGSDTNESAKQEEPAEDPEAKAG